MKQKLIILTAAVFLAGALSLIPVISAGDSGSVSVNTSAETEVSPDVAEISFAVRTFDTKSMQKATAANKEISDKVFGELKSLINKDNGDYIKTSDYRANPIYSYNDKKRVFDKYEVSNRIIVHTKSIQNIGKMIDKAITSGVTNVDSLNFFVSNYEAQCNDLLTVAVKKAKTRAEAVAKAMNTTLIGVNNITTSCSTNNYNQPRFYTAKNMLADTASGIALEDSQTFISNGTIKVNANVNASFFVK